MVTDKKKSIKIALHKNARQKSLLKSSKKVQKKREKASKNRCFFALFYFASDFCIFINQNT